MDCVAPTILGTILFEIVPLGTIREGRCREKIQGPVVAGLQRRGAKALANGLLISGLVRASLGENTTNDMAPKRGVLKVKLLR
jgi:hypothetical protein